MIKKIKKRKDIFFVFGIGVSLALVSLLGLSGIIGLPGFVSAATETETVVVTATIEPFLTFTVSPTSTSLTPYLVTSTGGTNIASSTNISLSVGTNDTDGWSIEIKGANDGLVNGGTTIDSVTASSTIAAGTDGYGANASGEASVTIGSYYDYWGSEDVGEIRTAGQTLASKATANAHGLVATMKVYAASISTNPAGSYTDTITLTATTATP